MNIIEYYYYRLQQKYWDFLYPIDEEDLSEETKERIDLFIKNKDTAPTILEAYYDTLTDEEKEKLGYCFIQADMEKFDKNIKEIYEREWKEKKLKIKKIIFFWEY
jgi:hypothetical protein